MWILARPTSAVRQQAILFLPQAKRPIDKPCQTCYTNSRYAAMAELADALVLGSSVYDVQVQVLLSALNNKNPNLFSTGERVRIFGFLQQSKMKIQMNAASRFFSRDAALFNSFGQWQLPAQPPLSSWQEWEPQACSASWA